MALAILVGCWLRWPSLQAGFFSDDFVQPAMHEGLYPAPRGPLDLFNFAAGNEQDNATLQRYGALPWWAAPNLRLAMMRPLSSALVLIDNALFGDNAVPYHVHSLLWWMLMMVAVAALLRELFSPRVAMLAIMLFALEEGHTVPLVWLANRGALVAMFFGVLGLLLHVRARSRQRQGLAWGAFGCFAVALLSGEWAFPLLGYVLAYELWDRRGPLAQRVLALWPAAVPGGLFLALRAHYRYGALNSGVYIDPITEPTTFFVAGLQRIPVFFADLFFSVPAVWWGIGSPWRDRLLSFDVIPLEIWLRMPEWRFWHVLVGVIAIGAAALTLRAGLRDRPAEERRQIRWLLLGALVALVPMVASFPTSRLVLPASLAASAAAASVILGFLDRMRVQWVSSRRVAWGSACVAGLVAYFQVWEAGRTSQYEARVLTDMFGAIHKWTQHADVDDAKIEQQSIMILAAVEHSTTIFTPWMRWFDGHPLPRGNFVLSAAQSAHDVYRPAPNVLELSVLGGTMMSNDLERLYRADRFPFVPGQRFEMRDFTVEIMRVRGGKAQAMRFIFERDVEDPSYLFLYASPEGLLRARLPEVGQRFRFRKAVHPNADFAERVRNEPDTAQRCVGAPPPLDECRVGYVFADCRAANGVVALEDAESPVFACHGAGDCRWFTGGCIAEGYVSSPCSAEDVCCLDGWPFHRDDFPSQGVQARLLHGLLGAYGHQPWAASMGNGFDVFVDPALPNVTPALRCHGGPKLPGSPCGLGNVDVLPLQQSSLRFSFWPPHLDGGYSLTTEVIDGRDGRLRARVCKVPSRPLVPYVETTLVCPEPAVPQCASRGTIVLSHFPLDSSRLPLMAARLYAEFDDGTRVEAEF